MKFLRRCLALSTCLLLAACSVPPVPDVTYYRLPPAAHIARAAAPISALPIEVETFRAEGVYVEQSVLYATSPDAGALRAYHYQLWSDPPSRALQERLTARLREAGIAPLVTDRLPASAQALRVIGRIVHYERVPLEPGAKAQVEFEMRVEQDSGEPLLERTYRAEQSAADGTMAATAQAFGAAVDETFAKFQADLIALTGNGR
jgi:cholesterol transport system auxiliary component